MVVEARYAAGSGLLLGSGTHWVLVSDPEDERVVQDLWLALTDPPPPGGDVTEQVLAVLQDAYDGDPPGLAMVDLTPGGSASVARGTGHVRLEGPARVLTLGEAAAPLTRRLLGGVANAAAVEVRPVIAKVPAVPAPGLPAPPAPSTGLIDGIPAAILAAKGPDGPPPPRARPPRADIVSADDTGSRHDTTEPDPGALQRIEDGGHTTIRPARASHAEHGAPATAPDPAPGDASRDVPDHPHHDGTDHDGTDHGGTDHGADHDGATTHRPGHLATSTFPTVLAVSCPLGHLTPATGPSCRVCHQRVAPQEPRRVQRPVLGGLRLPTGEVVPLDRGVVLGRKPAPLDDHGDWPHLVHLPSGHSYVSRLHLQVELDGWDVIARDLNSRGGSTIALPGRAPVRMTPGEAYVLEPGTVVDLADVYAVRYETGPVVRR